MFQVDSSSAYSMNPLAALSVDRNTLVGENYRPQGGNFYPSIQPLSGEKPREAGTSVPLRYDLLYKPDLTLLDGQKSANGYTGLYKSSPPGLQKPILVPAAGGDGLGLNHQSLSSVKQSELCLNGAGSFPRLPWISPYADATMYPFLDMAYKASFLSQPLPFIHQQLAYQSLCGSPSGEERPFYLSHYTPTHISSPLGPPLRIHTATPTPAILSTLSCSQDKTLQGLGPQVPRDHSAFRTSPQVHQEPSPQTVHLTERQHGSSGTKSTQPTSATSTLTSKGAESGLSSENSSTGSANRESSSTVHPPCSILPSQPFSRPSTDIPKTFNRGTTSSSTSLSLSHSSTVGSANSELCSSKKSENKTKDAGSGRCNVEKSFSPAGLSLRRDIPPKPARKAVENFLDLSAKELEGAQNGIPSKLEGLAKLGYLPPSSYGLSGNQDMPIKEGVMTPDNISTKKTDQSDKINTVSAPWVISCSSLVTSSENRRSQILKNRNTDHQPMSQKQHGSATSIGNDILNYATVGRPSELCPPPKAKVEQQRIPSSDLAKVGLNNKGEIHKSPGKHNTSSVKLEVPEIQSRHKQKQHLSLENGTSAGQIYGDSYLPPGLAYTSRYIPYTVAENISLQHLATGKAPIYPQLALLGPTFYPPRMAANHGISYGMHPNQGEVLAYPNSQSIAPPSISSLSCPDQQEFNDKTRNSELYKNKGRLDADKCKKSDNEKYRPPNETKKASKGVLSARDDVFIDLVHDETDHDPSTSRHLSVSTKNTDSSTKGGSSSNPTQERTTKALDLQATKPKEGQLLGATQALIPHQNASQHPVHCEENPEEPEPLSPLLDIPEQQTMRCARTSIQFCGRKRRALSSAGDLMRGYSNSSIHGVSRMGASNESKSEITDCKNVIPEQIHSTSDHSLDHAGKDIFENCNNSNTHCKADGLVCTGTGSECNRSTSQVSSCMSFNPRDPAGAVNRKTPLYVNVNPRSPEFNKRKPNGQSFLSTDSTGPCYKSLTPSTPTSEPINDQRHIDENGNPAASECDGINPRLHHPENQNTVHTACGNVNLRASTCEKKGCGEVSNGQVSRNDQICVSNRSRAVINCSPPGSNDQRCPNNGDLPASLSPELPVSDGLSSNMIDSKREETNSDFSSCGDGSTNIQESMASAAEKENQRTIIAKHISRSSGAGANAFSSMSTDVWANSDRLSREQRASQVRPAFHSQLLPHHTTGKSAWCCTLRVCFLISTFQKQCWPCLC